MQILTQENQYKSTSTDAAGAHRSCPAMLSTAPPPPAHLASSIAARTGCAPHRLQCVHSSRPPAKCVRPSATSRLRPSATSVYYLSTVAGIYLQHAKEALLQVSRDTVAGIKRHCCRYITSYQHQCLFCRIRGGVRGGNKN